MPAADWDQLVSTLTIARQAQRHTDLYIRRGGPPTRKPAGGHPPALSLTEQTLVTVLRLRFQTTQPALAQLFGVVTGTIGTAERQTRSLLDQHGYLIKPAGTRLRTLAELTSYARLHGIALIPKAKPAR